MVASWDLTQYETEQMQQQMMDRRPEASWAEPDRLYEALITWKYEQGGMMGMGRRSVEALKRGFVYFLKRDFYGMALLSHYGMTKGNIEKRLTSTVATMNGNQGIIY